MKKIAVFLTIIFLASVAFAAHKHLEKDYQKVWCEKAGGIIEYVLDDKTRVDCLTATHAVEVEFASKVYESVGQALYYAVKTGRKPGILLIIENPKTEQKYLDRLNVIAEKYGITVWTIKEGDL